MYSWLQSGEVVHCFWRNLIVTNLTQKGFDNLVISSLTYHWVKMQMDIEDGIVVRDVKHLLS
jgi:hypothetical protein